MSNFIDIKSALAGVFDTGFQCAFCDREIYPGKDACPECEKALTALKITDGRRALCAYKYDGIMRRLIHSIKYDDMPYKVNYAARLMHDAWITLTGGMKIDLMTYVPVHPKRKRKRGFDQGQMLCEELSILMGVPYTTLFERVKNTKPQYSLSAKERADNLAGAFKIAEVPLPDVRTIMIVDDILTTGATMGECAKLLPPYITTVPFALCYDE